LKSYKPERDETVTNKPTIILCDPPTAVGPVLALLGRAMQLLKDAKPACWEGSDEYLQWGFAKEKFFNDLANLSSGEGK